MKEYRATTTLNTKGGLIHKGELVPKSYPRFNEGIRRGWIELIDAKQEVKIPEPIIEEPVLEDAPSIKKSKGAPIGKEPKPEAKMTIPEKELEIEEIHEEAEASKLTEINPEPTEAAGNMKVADLDFINAKSREALHGDGIYTLEDLRDKSVTDLVNIKHIGFVIANKMIDAFDKYEDSIEGDENGE